MAQATWYTFKKTKETQEKPGEHNACFSSIYRKISEIEYINVFVFKANNKINYKPHINDEQIRKLVLILNRMKLIVSIKDCKFQDIEAYKFHINCSKNSQIGVLILLNMIRHIYEGSIDELFLLDRFVNNVNVRMLSHTLFNKLLVCLCVNIFNTNHSFCPEQDYYTKLYSIYSLYSKEQYLALITSNATCSNVRKSLNICRKDVSIDNFNEIRNMLKNNIPLIKIEKRYKQLWIK